MTKCETGKVFQWLRVIVALGEHLGSVSRPYSGHLIAVAVSL